MEYQVIFCLKCWHSILVMVRILVAPVAIQFPANVSKKTTKMTQIFGPLSPLGETQMEFQVPDFTLAQLHL